MHYYFRGMEAYRRNDYVSFLNNFKKAVHLAPNHPELIYHLARAYALLNDDKEAIRCLEKTVDLGYYFNSKNTAFDEAEANDFNLIKASDQFKAILAKIARKNIPINNSKVAFKLTDKDLMPEGIAYDPLEQTFYLGSGYERKIVSIDKDGELSDFASQDQDSLWNVWGLKVEPKRRLLWANSSPWYGMRGFDGKAYGFSGVFKFNLTNKRLVRKYALDERPILHDFNDLVITSRGDVFITDSPFGAVYVIRHKSDELELFIRPPRFTYPNGITLSGDERLLYVAHREGVSAIDINTGSCSRLSHADNITLASIDGLCFYQNSLIAIQNAHRPPRVVRFFLDKTLTKVRSAQIIESGNPLFHLPTTGVIVGDMFFYIANSQLDCYTDNQTIFPMDQLRDIVVLKTKL